MLQDAIYDAKQAYLAGAEIDWDSIAADYDLNAALLKRKFEESYPNGPVKLEQGDASWLAARVDETVERLCKKYGVPRERCTEETHGGVRYTVIGIFRTRLLGVSHKNARPYTIRPARR